MRGRYWPAALAVLSVLVFGTFLAYTQFLLRKIREQDRVHTEMFAAVQRGLLTLEEGGAELELFNLQEQLKLLDVPLVQTNVKDSIISFVQLPFDANDTVKLRKYVGQLRARRHFVQSPFGRVYYGSPPIVGWLRWVPWLQSAAGILLVLVAGAIIRANTRAERERMWAAMARELAHQMGTPLTSLSGWVEVLQLPDDEREAFGNANRIGRVIGSDVERLERVSRRFELIGKPPLLQRIDISDVAKELEAYFRPRLPKLGTGVELRVRMQRDLPAIEANGVLLTWALENIVKNAVDALAGKGGVILISAGRAGNMLRIRISDDGPGIAPEVRGRIFVPGVTTKTAGWGVGLSLTQRIVEELHGGRISVHDRRRGGTTFEILIPAAGTKLKRRFFSIR